MSTVLFRGGMLTQSGYGTHARQIFKYVFDVCNLKGHTLKTHILPWGDTPWILDTESHGGMVGEMMKRSVDIKEDDVKEVFDVSIQLQLPHEWNTKLGRVNVGVTAGIESDICRKDWVEACLRMDRVIVPSRFSKKVFIDSADSDDVKDDLEKRIVVIPESFPDLFLTENLDERKFDYEMSKNNILLVGQITGLNAASDRKNLFYTLRWMCESLHDRDDWGIVIKTNAARNTKIDRQIVLNMIKQLVKDVRKTRPNPKIHVIHGSLTDTELLDLYCDDRVKLFVSLTRGEGYGLPLLEAASVGLPIIATNWSGHLDFLNDQFMQVKYEMINVPESVTKGNLFAQGSKWANPDMSEFKRTLMSFINNGQYRKTHINKAMKLKSRVRKEYSSESVDEMYKKELGDILK